MYVQSLFVLNSFDQRELALQLVSRRRSLTVHRLAAFPAAHSSTLYCASLENHEMSENPVRIVCIGDNPTVQHQFGYSENSCDRS